MWVVQWTRFGTIIVRCNSGRICRPVTTDCDALEVNWTHILNKKQIGNAIYIVKHIANLKSVRRVKWRTAAIECCCYEICHKTCMDDGQRLPLLLCCWMAIISGYKEQVSGLSRVSVVVVLFEICTFTAFKLSSIRMDSRVENVKLWVAIISYPQLKCLVKFNMQIG